MSVQRRSFFALKCQHDYWTEFPAIPGISLCGGMPFTLGASFWYPHAGDDNILLQQEGVFTFGVKNGSVYFEARNLGSFRTDAGSEPKLLEEEWNRADVVYDGTAVRIYIQGLLALEAEAEGAQYIDQETRCRMGVMDGYLQEVVLYSRALTDLEVLHLPFTHAVPKEQTELWADFDVSSPADRGRHAFPLQLKGACTAVNLVYGFAPGRNGFALPYGSKPVNPGALASGELTLLAAVFPRELPEAEPSADGLPDDPDTVVFTNGVRDGRQTVALGLEGDTGRPFLTLGETRFPFSTRLNNYCWYQISAVVKGTDVSLYVDGEPAGTGTLTEPFVRTEAPALMIGNQDENGQMTRGFQGCIDLVAVFDAALPAEKLKVYADVPPYRFEEHLAALWLFSDPCPLDLISDTVLTYSSGTTGSALQENTVMDREPPALSFYMPDIPTRMDEVETWETRMAAEAILQGISAMTGAEPEGGFSGPDKEKLNGSMACLVAQYAGSNPQVIDLTTSGHTTDKDLGDCLAAVLGGAFAGAVCYGFYCYAQHGGLRRAINIERFLHFFKLAWKVSDWPLIGAALAGGVECLVKYFQKTPPPDPGTCTGEDFDVTFQSLSFYHENSRDAGALFGIPDLGSDPVLPEWTRGESGVTSAPALYHRDFLPDKIPSVVLSFHCEKKCEAPVELTFRASSLDGDGLDDVLGTPSACSITISSTGNYSITLPLPEHKLRSAGLGAHKIRWEWQISSPGIGIKVLGKTDHTIHVLAAKPLSPWTTEPNSKYPPAYPAISLCHLIAEENSTETDPDRRFAGQFVSWSHSGGKLEARAWADGSQYAAWGMEEQRVLAFDIRACVTALQNGKAQVGALDCACLHYALTRLEGLEKLRLFRLCSMVEASPLYLRPVRRIGAEEDDRSVLLDSYHVCGIPHEDTPPDIWDGFLTLHSCSSGTVTASGLAFSQPDRGMDMIPGPNDGQYRTLLCQPGSTCEVALTASWILMEQLPPQTIKPGEPVLQSAPGRPDFDKAILTAITLPPYQVRCHSISYKSMEIAVVEMVNQFYSGKIAVNEFTSTLLALWSAVTLNPTPGQPQDDFQRVALEKIELLSHPDQFAGKDAVAIEAELLVRALNNTQANIRLGMSDWNASAQDSFDPCSWAHIVNPFFSSPILTISNNGTQDSQVLPDKKYLGADLALTGFYLSDPRDAARIKSLQPYLKKPGLSGLLKLSAMPMDVSLPTAISSVSDRRPWILISSSNAWNLRDHPCERNKRTSSIIRYYLDDQGTGPKWVSF